MTQDRTEVTQDCFNNQYLYKGGKRLRPAIAHCEAGGGAEAESRSAECSVVIISNILPKTEIDSRFLPLQISANSDLTVSGE